MKVGKSQFLLFIGLGGLALAVGTSLLHFCQKRNVTLPLDPRLRAGAGARYVDPKTCEPCHARIYESYQRTGMGRSFFRLQPGKTLEDWSGTKVFYHQASARYYTMYERDGRYYQRRRQIGFDGKETNILEKEIHLVIGSGNHARTYLHKSAQGRLLELPVAWYSEKGGFWAMNPGYDRPDHHDFRRRITHECMFCHNAYPEIEPGSDGFGRESIYEGNIPEGIDCQRCHGPGRDHIDVVQNRNATADTVRASIVNPSRLSSERQLELCMQCHLETTSARLPPYVRRFNRGFFSFRPGEALSDYILHFDRAPQDRQKDTFEIAHQAYRLRMSRCFIKSGSMTCTTCHDPHNIPRGEEAVRHYAGACRSCHTAEFDRLIGAGRHTRSPDCAGCHMPKRRTDDVVHVVMTDHYIQRFKPARDLIAPLSEDRFYGRRYRGEIVYYYPPHMPAGGETELYLAVAQVTNGANLKDGISRLEKALETQRSERAEVYFELAEAFVKDGRLDKASAAYEEALRRRPDFWLARRGLGLALAKSGQLSRGAEELEKAAQIGTEEAVTLNDLALVYSRLGKPNEAIAALKKATNLDPGLSEAYNNLGGMLLERKDGADAEEAFRNAIRVQPDFSAAHNNLAKLLASAGNLRPAQHHFEKAIQSNPNFAQARYDYGLTLTQMEMYEKAQAQLEEAVRLQPEWAEALNTLGDVLALRGRMEEAIRRYYRAIELEPEYHQAHMGLASLLLLKRDLQKALLHFERAAKSPDPHIRQTALASLAKIRGR